MPQLTFPSSEAPAFCPFASEYPSTWVIDAAAAALAVVLEPRSDAFRANVIVGAVRLPIETQLDDATEAAREGAAEGSTDFRVLSEDNITVNAVSATMQLARFNVLEASEALAQLQVLLFAPAPVGAIHDLFRIHATSTESRIDEYLPVFRGIIESFRFVADDA